VFVSGIDGRERGGQRAIELTGAEQRFEISAGKGHIVFALSSPFGEYMAGPARDQVMLN